MHRFVDVLVWRDCFARYRFIGAVTCVLFGVVANEVTDMCYTATDCAELYVQQAPVLERRVQTRCCMGSIWLMMYH